MTGLRAARDRFAAAGLALPPIPAHLATSLRAIDDFVFGTRDDGPSPYSMEWYVDELLEGRRTDPYVLTGHAGRGMNSWAIHYLLVDGGLAVFDQIAWGGAYTDDDMAGHVMGAHWTQIGEMIDAVAVAGTRGLLGEERYVVVLSDFGGSRWARGMLTDLEWRRGGSPLEVLLDAVIDAQELAAT